LDAATGDSTAGDGKVHDSRVAREAVFLQPGEDDPLNGDFLQCAPGPLNRTSPFDRTSRIGQWGCEGILVTDGQFHQGGRHRHDRAIRSKTERGRRERRTSDNVSMESGY